MQLSFFTKYVEVYEKHHEWLQNTTQKYEMKLEKFCGLCLKWNHSTITDPSQTTKLDENDDEQPMELILLYEVDIDI